MEKALDFISKILCRMSEAAKGTLSPRFCLAERDLINVSESFFFPWHIRKTFCIKKDSRHCLEGDFAYRQPVRWLVDQRTGIPSLLIRQTLTRPASELGAGQKEGLGSGPAHSQFYRLQAKNVLKCSRRIIIFRDM